MAVNPIAYGEITILDLLDTATYIYYSEFENGQGATIAPQPNSKYIGIYSGPPYGEGQPSEPPEGTVWSKYVGDKGDGIEETIIQYGVSESATIQPVEWKDSIEEISVTPGKYLWIKTILTIGGQQNTSFSISRVGKDGEDGLKFTIETNQNEVLKFYRDKDIKTF